MNEIRLRKKFSIELENLSEKAKNTLLSNCILSFDSFYDQLFLSRKIRDFSILVGVGTKTKKELEDFLFKVFSSDKIYNKARTKFKKGLKKLGKKGLNTLNRDCILTFETFYDQFFIQQKRIDHRQAQYCVPILRKEVEDFVESMCESFRAMGPERKLFYLGIPLRLGNQLGSSGNKDTSFAFLESYINTHGQLKPIELYLFRHYFCFVIGYDKKSQSEIALKYNLSRERVRQKSVNLIGALKKYVTYLTEGHNLNFKKYFAKDYFIINQDSAIVINELENTKISHGFIAYVLSFTINSEYNIFNLHEGANTQSVLFVRKTIPVNFLRLSYYVEYKIMTEKFIERNIEISDLLKSFAEYPQSSSTIENLKYNLDDLVNILHILIEHINNKIYSLEIDSGMLKISRKKAVSKRVIGEA